MIESENNVLTCGLSIKIGVLPIFCRRYGQTIVPEMSKQSKTVSDNQFAQAKNGFSNSMIQAQKWKKTFPKIIGKNNKVIKINFLNYL
jgi:hypothetical protein